MANKKKDYQQKLIDLIEALEQVELYGTILTDEDGDILGLLIGDAEFVSSFSLESITDKEKKVH